MTIALAITTAEGIVLTTDTMRIVATPIGGNQFEMRRYTGADKLFPLSKRLPLGLLTCGEGVIGQQPVAVLAGDLARMIDDGTLGCPTDESSYSVKAVAEMIQKTICEQHYVPAYSGLQTDDRPSIGLVVAGYASGSVVPELWNCSIAKGGAPNPPIAIPRGIWFAGEPEAIHRLLRGVGVGYFDILGEVCSSPEEAVRFQTEIQRRLTVRLWHNLMPLRAAVELAEFLVHAESMFSRFAHVGFSSVGGGIDTATITHGRGFELIRHGQVLGNPWRQRAGVSGRRIKRQRS